MRRSSASVLAVLALSAVMLAACAKDTPSETPAAQSPATQSALKVSDTKLGQVLTDSQGLTVYAFTQDSDGKSVCTSGCAEKWPPLAVQGEATGGDGVDAALLGTIARDDGTMQLTYNEMPLYHFANDAAAGDVKGQGVGGVWFAVSAEGSLVKGAASKY